MAKLRLIPDPTFSAKVGIPVAGGEPADVQFTFKHRTRAALLAWTEECKDKPDPDVVLDMVSGWDLDDAFTPENVAKLCDNYPGAGTAIYVAYLGEIRGARAKN